jgi:NADPH:quinone reductase-like Zn-dependent oxidoreductase
MKRVVVDHFGGPEVFTVVDDDDPQPGPGEVRVRVLAAGVSFTDAQLRAGTYLGVPKPQFTPGYELVGVVDELGLGCSRLRSGVRVAALTAWGVYAERVCVPEAEAVEVPDELDPAEVVSLVLTYMTAYQLLHRMARASTVRRCWCTARPAGWEPQCSSSARWPDFACSGPLRPATASRSSAASVLDNPSLTVGNADTSSRRETTGRTT